MIPGPPELLPMRPDAVVDLQTAEGVGLVGGEWRYADTEVAEIDFVAVGPDLGPSGAPTRTYDVVAGPERPLAPEDTQLRLGPGRVSFNWYRIAITIPERLGELDPTGATIVFEVVVDDYAEVWVDAALPLALGLTGGQVVGGFNTPNRVVLTQDARPGQRFDIAVFGINGPISTSPRNYIWMRSATLDVYAPEHARVGEDAPFELVGDVDLAGATLERVAGGFEFTEGPLWTPDGALLFSSPNTNTLYRWSPLGTVTVFRPKSGYSGGDIGRFTQPGSNGLAFDPQGRLAICQHGNRRVIRVNPHGDVTVLADRYDGKRLNSPNDLVYRSDGTLFFTDPPFGLPGMFDDPKKELQFSGVFRVSPQGEVVLVTDELAGPNGLAFSPHERFLYVGNWDQDHPGIMRYELDVAGAVTGRDVFHAGEDPIDGIKVGADGVVYACGPSGVLIVAPDGRHLGTLRLPEEPHNLAWGDADGLSLYITATTSIYRFRWEHR